MGNVNIILRPMVALFNRPYGKTEDDMVVILQEYNQSLSQFSDEVLTEAWQRIKSSKDKFPSLKECIDICSSVHIVKPINVERIITDDDIFQSNQGQEALKHGFGNDYAKSCRKINRIAPFDLNSRKMRRAEMMAGVEKLSEPFKGNCLRSFKDSAKKEEKLKEKYYE